VTENKRTERAALRPGDPKVDVNPAWELIGVDGSLEGPLRPFPGFVNVYELDPFTNQETYLPANTHGSSSQILDFWPVELRVGSDEYAYGLAYRVLRADETYSDVFLDIWLSNKTRAHTTDRWIRGLLLAKEVVANGGLVDVKTLGRFGFLSIQGRPPVMFYADPDSLETIKVVGSDPAGTVFPGPGAQPKLFGPYNFLVSSTWSGLGGTNEPTNGATSVGGVLFVPSGGGALSSVYAGLNLFSLCQGSGSSTSSGFELGQAEEDAKIFYSPNAVAFAYQLQDSRTGRKSPLSEITTFDAAVYGSTTDGWFGIEIVWDPDKWDQALLFRSVDTTQAGGPLVASQLFLERIIDLECFDTNRTLTSPYRSAVYFFELDDKELVFQDMYLDRVSFDETMPTGGAMGVLGNTLVVGGIRDPQKSAESKNDASDANRGLGEIRWSTTVDISPELFPPFNRYVPSVPSNEVIAFSPLGDNLVGFSRDKQYIFRRDSIYMRVREMHEGFGIVGKNTVERVGSLCFFLNNRGLNSVDVNGQLEDVKALNHLFVRDWRVGAIADSSLGTTYGDYVSMAFDPLLSTLFIHNSKLEKTVCVWFSTSKITEVYDTPFIGAKRGPWPKDIPLMRSVTMAHAGLELYADVANPPSNVRTAIGFESELQERAIFVEKNPDPGWSWTDPLGGSKTGYRFRVYLVDNERVKTITGSTVGMNSVDHEGATRVTTMDILKDSRFTTTATVSGSTVTLTSLGANKPTLDTSVKGAYLYVLDSSDSSYIGLKAKISHSASNVISLANYYTEDNTNYLALQGLPSGSRILISPIYFRWTGYPVMVQTDDGQIFSNREFFQIKQVDAIGIALTNVSGAALVEGAVGNLSGTGNSATDPRFRALVYKGSEADPTASAYPRSMNAENVASIQIDEGLYHAAFGANNAATNNAGRFGLAGNVLTPGVEILACDMDFRLISVIVTGSIRDTIRSRMASTR